ncbi:MAG: hypothetical protein RMJ33_03715 [Saprospiraceae bacterium]|nr:hypothetical protein [Saprospiraceae bacterium]MDW8228927.1 hypothetical protein [Saprospiraceae bacterium]
MKNLSLSRWAYAGCALFVLAIGIFYYPKWNQGQTEAMLSWDVSGYYFYLPAVFIYRDIKQLSFRNAIHQKYRPSDGPYQAFLHPSGNYVLKYSCGLAVQYLPFFGVAHALAQALGYEADGFSYPYQVAIGMGSLLVALLGLWVLRRNLLHYFSDAATAVTLVLLILGTNYLDYAAITGAMTHNYLFTLYALLIAATISYYAQPLQWKAIVVGGLLGLMTLTRPTEILAAILPLIWGVANRAGLAKRWLFWKNHWHHLLPAMLAAALVLSIQVAYWKFVTGEWWVYSYQDQAFDWLRPHLFNGLISYRKGWLIYTPMMVFALIGFWHLWKRHRDLFWAIGLFFALFLYVTFAWSIWWYGGSLGQRAMVQSYAVLAFPLTAFAQQVLSVRHTAFRAIFWALCAFFVYYNLWLTHQAHRGGLLEPEFMTRAYFWRIFLRWQAPVDAKKLLDTDCDYGERRRNIRLIYENNFEGLPVQEGCPLTPIEGQRGLCLSAERQFSEVIVFPIVPMDGAKLRVWATFRAGEKEWNVWKMAQFIVKVKSGEQTVHERMIRVFRMLNGGETREIYQDLRLPKVSFDRIEILFWNAESDKPLAIDRLRAEQFD